MVQNVILPRKIGSWVRLIMVEAMTNAMSGA
jgi:hypothetical protein